MRRINDAAELAEFYNRTKRNHGKVVSNCYLSQAEKEEAASKGKLFCQEEGKTIFLIYDDVRSLRLFYFSPSLEDVESDLNSTRFDGRREMIMEEMSRRAESPFHFMPAMTLNQMVSREMPADIPTSSPHVKAAQEEDIEDIELLLCENFNPILERVPDKEQLMAYFQKEGIFVFKVDEKILGVVVFEINGKTIELKYWLAVPESRGKGVGSALIHEFFRAAAANGCSSMFLFVDVNNENAIKRYEHFGFNGAGRYDLIYKIV